MASPLDQFQIKPIVPIEIAGLNLAFTNSALWMTLAVAAATFFLVSAASGARIVPGRMQSAAEVLYEFIAGMVRENVGDEGKRYFPFFFTLFMFVLFGNLAGMIPGSFTFTSHIVVTFTMALIIFVVITAIGIARHGTHFFSLFFPHGAPLATAPILIPIEVVSYLSRPVSLSVRLFANMTVGHIILKIFAGFVISLGAFFVLPGVVPFSVLVGITALEFFIAALQAYIFTILSCIYLNDAINLH
ncbi:MAG: F0F1 ATP synthase subunit A [Azospirillum sp.]|nr:F0F1 ATP synthase subunit A [Azospirillum sp.]MCA3267474.1 F0F1 ATP synthase subunit A [Azospirillum sp.]MCZ8124575.1 F0F1 ATP synthase subunit A [Magnetospirillum sp.]